MTLLNPGKTVAAFYEAAPPAELSWSVDCPTFQIRHSGILGTLTPKAVQKRLPVQMLHSDDFRGLFEFFRQHEAGVILGEYLNCSWPLIKLTKKHGIKLFAHAHGHDLSSIFRNHKWRSKYSDFEECAGLIVVNQVMRKRLLSIGIPDKKIHIIPYGVDVAGEHPGRARGENFRWLAVGRLVAKKAPLNTLRAFEIVLKSNQDMHLDIVGDGPLLEEVATFLKSRALDEKVSLHGGQSTDYVKEMMRQADGFVQHSIVDPISGDEEGVPVAILEAMAAALPVISTQHTGIPEAVIHGETGFLTEEGNIEEMAEFMLRLGETEGLRENMSRACWERAREQFTWEKERRDLLDVLYAA